MIIFRTFCPVAKHHLRQILRSISEKINHKYPFAYLQFYDFCCIILHLPKNRSFCKNPKPLHYAQYRHSSLIILSKILLSSSSSAKRSGLGVLRISAIICLAIFTSRTTVACTGLTLIAIIASNNKYRKSQPTS
jgi:hypothetical protein